MTIHLLKRGGTLLATLLAATQAQAADLTLKRVLLSTGGVGYFEYAADVDAATTLGLDVPLDQVDDVLMSLVVFDSAGGIGGIELPGESVTNTAFGDVPFGPDAMNSALAYLNSLQGVEITVQGPRPMTGRLLQVEQANEPGKTPDSTIIRTRGSVLTAAGLQQFVLEDTDSVQVSDRRLRARILRALETLRRSSAHDVRHLTLRSTGAGHRTVTVGYVAGAPLWKTSYRLVLPHGTDDKARLQGWAVLENQSAADWNGVALTLQAGNPVTFRQAIYRSYYVQRPTVPMEVLGRILPDVDTAAGSAPASAHALGAQAAPPPALAPMMMRQMAQPSEESQASEGAEQTSFALPTPVILAAGHTASVPILDRAVPVARLGLVQRGRPHPLAAIRLTNDSGSSLPPGVLTLYDTDPDLVFAGDARLAGLPIKESRLLSFAEDLRTEVDWQTSQATTIAGVTAAAGVLHVEERLRTTHQIALTAPPAEPRTLLVEIARQGDTKLVPIASPAPAEATATAWRIPVSLQPGQTTRLTVAVDQPRLEQTALIENSPLFARVLDERALSDTTRTALRHLADLRRAEAAAVAARDQLHTRQTALEADEDRVRKNLDAVPAKDALHVRLVRQLDADETQLAALATALTTADTAVDAARKALQDAIGMLKIL